MFNPDNIAILLGTLSNQAVLRIINLLTGPEAGGGLKTEQMLSLGIPKSTLYRVLSGLIDQGLVEINKEKRYQATAMTFHFVELLGHINGFSRSYRKRLIRDKLKEVLFDDKAIEAAVNRALEVEETGNVGRPAGKSGKMTRNVFFPEVLESIKIMVEQIKESKYQIDLIIGVSSGGAIVGGLLSRALNIPLAQVIRSQPSLEADKPEESKIETIPDVADKRILLVDDICKSGYTLNLVRNNCETAAEVKTAALLLMLQEGEDEDDLPSEKRLDYRVFTTDNISVKMPWDTVTRND